MEVEFNFSNIVWIDRCWKRYLWVENVCGIWKEVRCSVSGLFKSLSDCDLPVWNSIGMLSYFTERILRLQY